jgi:geranylgeranyl pyrophosphate synthase
MHNNSIIGVKGDTVLAPYTKSSRTKALTQIEITNSTQNHNALPVGLRLKQLLALRHGWVGDEIWRAAMMDAIQDLTMRPAKRFRGQLVTLAYRLTSGACSLSVIASQRCDILADAAELIHAGSLIVDDIQDGSPTRRGSSALHIRYGLPVALNAGSWLYFWAFQLIKKAGLSKSAEMVAYERCQRTLLRAHFGQALDVGANIENVKQEDVPGVCLAAMELKSGALMGFALTLGGLLALVPERGLTVLDDFGHDLGVALQMFDDLGNAQGKRDQAKQYEDLLLHRPSWVWACAAQDYTPDEYRRFADAVRELPQNGPLDRWFERTGLIESCQRRAVEHMNASYEALADKLERENVSWSREVFRELRAVGASIAEAYV